MHPYIEDTNIFKCIYHFALKFQFNIITAYFLSFGSVASQKLFKVHGHVE